MTIVFEGKEYEINQSKSFEELVDQIKKLNLQDLFEDGSLRWNVSFMHDGVFNSQQELMKIDIGSIRKLNIILQLAGG